MGCSPRSNRPTTRAPGPSSRPTSSPCSASCAPRCPLYVSPPAGSQRALEPPRRGVRRARPGRGRDPRRGRTGGAPTITSTPTMSRLTLARPLERSTHEDLVHHRLFERLRPPPGRGGSGPGLPGGDSPEHPPPPRSRKVSRPRYDVCSRSTCSACVTSPRRSAWDASTPHRDHRQLLHHRPCPGYYNATQFAVEGLFERCGRRSNPSASAS